MAEIGDGATEIGQLTVTAAAHVIVIGGVGGEVDGVQRIIGCNLINLMLVYANTTMY